MLPTWLMKYRRGCWVRRRRLLEEYVLHCQKTLTTARARVEHLRAFFGAWRSEASTVNRETSGLSRMFRLAIRRGQLEPIERRGTLARRARSPASRCRGLEQWLSNGSRDTEAHIVATFIGNVRASMR